MIYQFCMCSTMEKMKTQPKLSEAQLYGKADTGSSWRSERIPQWGVNYLKTPDFGTRSTLTCMHIVTHWKNDCILWKDCLGFFFPLTFLLCLEREKEIKQNRCDKIKTSIQLTKRLYFYFFLLSFFLLTVLAQVLRPGARYEVSVSGLRKGNESGSISTEFTTGELWQQADVVIMVWPPHGVERIIAYGLMCTVLNTEVTYVLGNVCSFFGLAGKSHYSVKKQEHIN